MEKTSLLLLGILLTENFFLVLFLWAWCFRECKNCGKEKKISRLLNKTCDSCNGKSEKGPSKKKETMNIF